MPRLCIYTCRSNSFKSPQTCVAPLSPTTPSSSSMSLPTLSDSEHQETTCCAALTTTQPTLTGISDSGADISIASYATIEKLNIPIFQLDSPIHITFANGTKSSTMTAVSAVPNYYKINGSFIVQPTQVQPTWGGSSSTLLPPPPVVTTTGHQFIFIIIRISPFSFQ